MYLQPWSIAHGRGDQAAVRTYVSVVARPSTMLIREINFVKRSDPRNLCNAKFRAIWHFLTELLHMLLHLLTYDWHNIACTQFPCSPCHIHKTCHAQLLYTDCTSTTVSVSMWDDNNYFCTVCGKGTRLLYYSVWMDQSLSSVSVLYTCMYTATVHITTNIALLT